MNNNQLCHGCKHLYSRPDAAGGGLYLCKKHFGIVRGEYGHWTNKIDEPKGCIEKEVIQNGFEGSN